MLLKIIDIKDKNDKESPVLVKLEVEGLTQKYEIKDFSSPFSPSFHELFSWYYKDYLNTPVLIAGDRQFSQKLIKFGQYMGDQLLGEDHELLKIIQIIEAQGYENLEVEIHSNSVRFFSDMWESLVMHDSTFILSSITRSYVRCFSNSLEHINSTEINYELDVREPEKEFFQGSQGELPADRTPPMTPLNILHLVSLPLSQDYSILEHGNAFDLSLSLSDCFGSEVHHEIAQPESWSELELRITSFGRQIHILHLECCIQISESDAFICNTINSIDENQTRSDINLKNLSSFMCQNKIGVLFLDIKQYGLPSGEIIPAEKGLAVVAKLATNEGLGNVVGLNSHSDPYTIQSCFFEVYQQILNGFCLAQAVVEARKALQARTSHTSFSVQPVTFHSWPLLVHYGGQPVNFFTHPANSNKEKSETLGKAIYEKLHGFSSEYLPPLVHQVGNRYLLNVLRQIEKRGCGCVLNVKGKSGIGKTQLAHGVAAYLAKISRIDYGFYFDFAANNYSSNDMLNMIAQVISVTPIDSKTCKEKLEKLHCLFVFDGLTEENSISENHNQLSEIVNSLVSSGHHVILSGDTCVRQGESTLSIDGLPLSLVRSLSAKVLRERLSHIGLEQLQQLENDAAYYDLLNFLGGNPWLIKKVLPLLENEKPEELVAQLQKMDLLNFDASIDEKFFCWRWKEMPIVYKNLLKLCAQDSAVLMEMLVAAVEQSPKSNRAHQLLDVLGDSQDSIAKAVAIWDASGFLVRFPHGRIIDTRAKRFILKQQWELNPELLEKAKLSYSLLVCEGVRMLSSHLVKNPQPYITNNLLLNRRVWVKHLERLWFNKKYGDFVKSKSAFEQLLKQAKLYHESQEWSLDLLSRTELTDHSGGGSTEATLAWLNLAILSLNIPDAAKSPKLVEGVKHWHSWCEELDKISTSDELAIYQQATVFLETFYSLKSEWQTCIRIAEKCRVIFRYNSIWNKLVGTLKRLAVYHSSMGEESIAKKYESELLEDIPYRNAPSGYKSQQMLDLLFVRLQRNAFDDAQKLLDQLRKSEDAGHIDEVLDAAQCEIHFQKKEFELVLPYYWRVLNKANQQNNPDQIDKIKTRLDEIEKSLGTAEFDRICNESLHKLNNGSCGPVKPAELQRENDVVLH